VSEKTAHSRQRRRRSDADRNVAAILETAVATLNESPGASVGEIAEAAGLTRQTVYAHFPSRDALIAAVTEHVTRVAVEVIDAADLEDGSPVDAMRRYLAAGWQILERHPLLLGLPASSVSVDVMDGYHGPIRFRLERLVERGQASGEFDTSVAPGWLAAAIIGLGHTAAEQVSTGALTMNAAKRSLEHSVLRMLDAPIACNGASGS